MARLAPLMIGGLAALGSACAAAAARRSWRAARIAQRQLATLTSAVSGLARTAEPDDFLVAVLRAIADQLDARWVLLFLHDAAHDTLVPHLVLNNGEVVPREQATPHLLHPVRARDIPLWVELERVRRPIHIADVQNDQRLRQRADLVAQGVRSLLLVPLLLGESLIGWFSVRATSRRTYRADELDLAAALAQQAALAVQLSRLGAQGRQAAVLAERNRMAREIHDTLAQGFTGIFMQLEACESALETARVEVARQRLALARDLARESLNEARRSVWALRPQALEQQPFVAALRAAASAQLAGSRLQLAFASDGPVGPMPVELEADLLRVVQEALTNCVKHAAARSVTVQLRDDGQHLEVQIRDNGQGFAFTTARPADGGGFGLTAMRERMERHGGQLIIDTAPGQGTTIIARVNRRHVRPSPPAGREEP